MKVDREELVDAFRDAITANQDLHYALNRTLNLLGIDSGLDKARERIAEVVENVASTVCGASEVDAADIIKDLGPWLEGKELYNDLLEECIQGERANPTWAKEN